MCEQGFHLIDDALGNVYDFTTNCDWVTQDETNWICIPQVHNCQEYFAQYGICPTSINGIVVPGAMECSETPFEKFIYNSKNGNFKLPLDLSND